MRGLGNLSRKNRSILANDHMIRQLYYRLKVQHTEYISFSSLLIFFINDVQEKNDYNYATIQLHKHRVHQYGSIYLHFKGE
jgi:hypothetical protein